MVEGHWPPLWQVLTVPARVLSLRVNTYGFCGRRFDRAQQPHASLVRESTACGRYGLFRWEYDHHSLFNTTPMEPTTEEDAEHDSDAERDWDYDDDDDLGGIKIVHQSYKSRQVQAIQTGFLKHIEQLR